MAVAPSEIKGRGQSSLKREVRASSVFPPVDTNAPTISSPPEANRVRRIISPLEPPDPGPEPEYGSVTAKQWELWVAAKETRGEYFLKRERADIFIAENDLRGTF